MIPNWVKKSVFLPRLSFLIVIGLVVTVVLSTITISRIEKKFEKRVFPNVYIDKVSVGGKTKEEIRKIFSTKDKPWKNAILTVLYEKHPIATFSAEKLKLQSNLNAVVEEAYLIGRDPHFLPRFKQQTIILLNLDSHSFTTKLFYDKATLQKFINQVEKKYNKPAENALFQFENGRVMSFQQEKPGKRVQSEVFLTEMEEAILNLKSKPKSKNIILKGETIKPEISLAESNNLGIEELIGTGVSNFAGSIPGRIHNIELSSSKFNGVLIKPGEEFSFNQVVGDISASTGYQQAYIIKGGKTVLGDGGGVCQTSTTLFRAALNTGLPITQRFAHAYRVGYYENDSQPGFDATVYAPSVDFRFMNDTPGHILIQTTIDYNTAQLYFHFYGKRDGRQVEISPAAVSDVVPPPPEVRQDDPSLKKGVVKQVDFAAYGSKANFTYRVYKDGKVAFEKNFFSNYRPWQAVFLVGTAD